MRSRAGKSDALGAKVECGFTAGDIMRTVIVLVSAILPSVSLADSVRHLSVPERFWGTWAPEADLCRNDKAIFVVSARGCDLASELHGPMGHRNGRRRQVGLLRPYALL
jgi:hypothetical protein